MDWREAEEAARAWMVRHGFPDAVLTPSGSDQGVDVRADDAVAQVKAHATAAGRPSVQNLVGIASTERRKALFFATGGYTPAARVWADRAGVALFRLRPDGDVVPMNEAAEQLDGAAASSGRRPKPAVASYRLGPVTSLRAEQRRFKKEMAPHLGFGNKGKAKRLWLLARKNETVLAVASTSSRGSKWVMVTDRRLVVAGYSFSGLQHRAFGWSLLTDVRVEDGVLHPRLTWSYGGRTETVKMMNASEAKTVRAALRRVGHG
jgi:Restriction endonuclease/Bacterial PH domain